MSAARERACLIQPVPSLASLPPSLSLPLYLSLSLPPSPLLWTGWLSLMRKFTPTESTASVAKMSIDMTVELRWGEEAARRWQGVCESAAKHRSQRGRSGLHRVSHGVSGQRRATGFRSENQQVKKKKTKTKTVNQENGNCGCCGVRFSLV